jgi:hypothetical protein
MTRIGQASPDQAFMPASYLGGSTRRSQRRMKNPFRMKPLSGNIQKFKGTGNVQIIRMNNIEAALAERLHPEDMVRFLKQDLSYVLRTIKKYSGLTIRYTADEALTKKVYDMASPPAIFTIRYHRT